MRPSFFALLVSAQVAPSPAMVDTVTVAELDKAVESLIDFRPKDTFDIAPKPSFAGRRFIIDIPVEESSLKTGNYLCLSTWLYNLTTGQLKVSVRQTMASTYTQVRGPGSPMTGAPNSAYYGVPFICKRDADITYVGQNGFGAKTDITKRRERQIGFSSYDGGYTDSFTRTVSAAEGRELVGALRIRFSGTIGSWEDGGSIGCTRKFFEPTFSAPIESEETTCLVKTTDVKVELIDIRTSDVLFTRPSTPPPSTNSKKRR